MFLAMLAFAFADPAAAGGVQGQISSTDYPLEAVQRRLEGIVRVDLTIGTNGRVTSCKVTRSSRHRILDKRTCEIMKERARLKPAKDAAGRAIESHFETSVSWSLH